MYTILKNVHQKLGLDNNFTLFSSALKVSKTSAKMWSCLANIYLNTGNNSMAELLVKKALEVEPQFVPAHINLVCIMKKEKRFNEAIKVKEAITLIGACLVIQTTCR